MLNTQRKGVTSHIEHYTCDSAVQASASFREQMPLRSLSSPERWQRQMATHELWTSVKTMYRAALVMMASATYTVDGNRSGSCVDFVLIGAKGALITTSERLLLTHSTNDRACGGSYHGSRRSVVLVYQSRPMHAAHPPQVIQTGLFRVAQDA